MILFTSTSLNLHYLNAALQNIGEKSGIIIPNTVLFDNLYQTKPKYLFMHSSDINDEFSLAKDTFTDTKFIVYNDDIDNEHIVEKFNPDLLLYHKDIKPSTTVKSLELKGFADAISFGRGFIKSNMKSDIFYLSDCSLENRLYINDVCENLLSLPYKFIICGNVNIGLPNYLGGINFEDVPHFFSSTKINIDFDQTTMYNSAINQTFALSNKENELFPSFNDNNLEELLNKFVKDEKSRRNIIKKAYKKVISKDTSFHRIHEIGKILKANWIDKSYEKIRHIN